MKKSIFLSNVLKECKELKVLENLYNAKEDGLAGKMLESQREDLDTYKIKDLTLAEIIEIIKSLDDFDFSKIAKSEIEYLTMLSRLDDIMGSIKPEFFCTLFSKPDIDIKCFILKDMSDNARDFFIRRTFNLKEIYRFKGSFDCDFAILLNYRDWIFFNDIYDIKLKDGRFYYALLKDIFENKKKYKNIKFENAENLNLGLASFFIQAIDNLDFNFLREYGIKYLNEFIQISYLSKEKVKDISTQLYNYINKELNSIMPKVKKEFGEEMTDIKYILENYNYTDVENTDISDLIKMWSESNFFC